jgi:AcrR family transcriptional regulator
LFISMVRELTKATLDTMQDMVAHHPGSTADLLREAFRYIYAHIVEDRRRREVARMLIAEAPRFPALTDRYREEIHGPCHALLDQVIQRGIDRGEIRPSAVTACPQVIIAPIAQVDLWIMLYEDRQPLDLKAYFDAHVELVLRGLFARVE